MTFSIPGLIASFGIFLSFFLSTALFFVKGNRRAFLPLMGLLISLGLALTYEVLYPFGIYVQFPALIKTYIPTQMLIGPFLYFYVSQLTDSEFRFTWSTLAHFIPFIVVLVYLIPFFISPPGLKIQYAIEYLNTDRSTYTEEWIFWLMLQVSSTTYASLCLRKLLMYRKRIKEFASDLSKKTLDWLFLFNLCNLLNQISFCVIDILMLKGIPLACFNDFISVTMTLTIILMGIKGITQIECLSIPLFTKEPDCTALGATGDHLSAKDYLTAEFWNVKQAIQQQKWYLLAELTLTDLSRLLNISRTQLSQIINSGGKICFYDFINAFRVEEMKQKLKNPESQKFNLLELAFDSGFNSKSTLQRAFKKHTGMTPLQYKKTLFENPKDSLNPQQSLRPNR